MSELTEEIEAIAKRLVMFKKRDGRSVYEPGAKEALVRACQRPGMSLARIARICGINANVLSHWVRLHERGRAAQGQLPGEAFEMAAPAFVAMELQPARAAAAVPEPLDARQLRIELPNGVTVQLQGLGQHGVISLIEALGSLRCSASTKA